MSGTVDESGVELVARRRLSLRCAPMGGGAALPASTAAGAGSSSGSTGGGATASCWVVASMVEFLGTGATRRVGGVSGGETGRRWYSMVNPKKPVRTDTIPMPAENPKLVDSPPVRGRSYPTRDRKSVV